MKMENLAGQKFGRLLVIEFQHKDRHGHPHWMCRCDCGTERVFHAPSMKRGRTVSCGCHRRAKARESIKEAQKIPNKNRIERNGFLFQDHSMYRVWKGIKQRCLNPRCKEWKHYGGRGITLYPDWFEFINFVRDMGERPNGYWIERIDNNGNYEPGNVRWATCKEQQNNKRTNRNITVRGETLTMKQWAEKVGSKYEKIRKRLNSGWSPEEAIFCP